MKKVVGLLIIILSLIAFKTEAQEVVIPGEIAQKVMEDLILKDHLQYTVNKQDSIIRVYEIDLNKYKTVVKEFKLNESQYQLIISNLNEVVGIQDAEIKDLKHDKNRFKLKTLITDIFQYTVIVVLTYLLINQ